MLPLYYAAADAGLSDTVVPTHRGMLFACWAIVIVLLAVSFVFLRSNKKEYAAAVLPLLLVPLAHIGGGMISQLLDAALPLSFVELRVLVDVTAGLFSCLLLGLVSIKLPEPRVRRLFFIGCALFVIILTMILVTNTLISARV